MAHILPHQHWILELIAVVLIAGGTIHELRTGPTGYAMFRIRVASAVMLATGAMVLGGVDAHATTGKPPVVVHPACLDVVGSATTATWASSNWSGYAETGHFTAVSGSWTVPSVTAGRQSSSSAWYSATWLGIDGFNDTNLIQTGTEQDYYGGSTHYSAWWEILPAAETKIPYSVSPGDVMVANIVETPMQVRVSASGRHGGAATITEYEWTIALKDTTHPWSFTTTQAYGGAGSSVEWVVEAPEVNNAIASLADYSFPSPSASSGDFNTSKFATTIGGALTGAGLNYANDSGVMIQNRVQVSTPGQPDALRTAFDSLYGTNAPSAPTS